MPNTRQRTRTGEEVSYPRVPRVKRKNYTSRWIAIGVIVLCIITTVVVLVNKLSAVEGEDGAIAAGAALIEPTPTPTPTPTPKPTPSPVDESKIGDYPADLAKALIVNTAGSETKIAYLTFDDGPSSNTEKILDILKKYNAKATFFVTGKMAEAKPEIIKREFEEGHTVANHSYSHDYKYIYASAANFKAEIEKTENILAGIIGKENVMKLFRFPGGSAGAVKKPYRTIIEETGYKYVDWNALNSDADGKPFSAERCMSEIKKYCTDTGDIVVLMHDANAKKITADTLPAVMDYLIEQGYTFERIVP